MKVPSFKAAVLLAAVSLLHAASPSPAFAEAAELRVSRGYSVLYLPQMMMRMNELQLQELRAER